MLDIDEYARQMRLALCPEEMITEDGWLREEYFQPKTDVSDGVVWTEESVEKLLEGIERYGVGHWSEIRQTLLVHWDDIAIKMKTCLLLGCQNVEAYQDQKLTKAQIAAEREKNESLGRQEGTWRCGVVPDKDFGWICTEEASPFTSQST